MNPASIYNTLQFHGTNPTLAQYLIYNLFRILRPLRKRYKLTINEIIILNGIFIYNKLVSTSFTKSSIRRFNGYFNNNKSDYYINSLLDKECIVISDQIKNTTRYKISERGISIIDDIDKCYEDSLYKFITDNSIVL